MIRDNGNFIGDHVATAFCENGEVIAADKAYEKFRKYYYEKELPWWCCGKESAGNGALLRSIAHILPYLKTGSEEFWANLILSVIITHNDVLAITSSLAFAFLVTELLKRETAPEPLWYVKTFCSIAEQIETNAEYETTINNEPYCGTLPQFLSTYLPELYEKGLSSTDACASFKSTSYLMETIPSILYILMKHADCLEEAIVRAVNDTIDNGTIAACVGAAVGALHGKKTIPESWLSQLSGRTTLAETGSTLQKIISDAKTSWWD
jgi:ADP-ribosylglycohydrolase